MAANEDEQGPQATDGDATERRPIAGTTTRRKPQPITIDLAASAVRIEQAPDKASPGAPEVPSDAPAAADATPAAADAASGAADAASGVIEHVGDSDAAPAAGAGSPAPSGDAHVTADAPPEASAGPATANPPRPIGRPQLLAASLVGGAIGLVAAYGLAGAGLWPAGNSAAVAAQLAALETRLAATETKVGPNGALATELEHLKSLPSIPGVTIADVEKILDPFTAKTAAAVAHMDEIDRKIAGEQAVVRGESKASQDALTAKMAMLANAVADSTAETHQLAAHVDTLQHGFAALEQKSGDQLASVHAELSATVQALASRLTDLDTRTAAELAVLRGTAHETSDRLAAAEKAALDLTNASAAIRKSLTDQGDGIAKLQAQLQPIDDMRKAIDGLGARIGAVDDVKTILQQQTAKLSTADDAKKAADGVAASLWIIDQRMSTVQARLADVDALKTALAGDAKAIATLETRVAPVEAKLAGLDGYAKQGLDARQDAVAAVAIANLKSAADTGMPFANELATAKTIVGARLDLSRLDRFAGNGLTPEARLVAGFDAAARGIADTGQPPAGDGGILGTLLSHAAGSVKVVPTSAEAGDSLAARLSRIDAKLKAHDLAAALSEWQVLPEAARAASADWGAALKTHVEGSKAVAAIAEDVMAKLTAASQ